MQIQKAQSLVAELNALIRDRQLEGKDGHGLLRHLEREVSELRQEAEGAARIDAMAEEAADILIVLMAFCETIQVDLATAFVGKMSTNFKRDWKEPDEEGVIEHATDPRTPISDDGTASDEA